jgi:hypothetical protein
MEGLRAKIWTYGNEIDLIYFDLFSVWNEIENRGDTFLQNVGKCNHVEDLMTSPFRRLDQHLQCSEDFKSYCPEY